MNSLTLKETGFSEFFPLSVISFSNVPHDKGSVFVIIDNTLSDKPTSDILYIGRSKKPSKKILGGFLAGYGGKSSKKINAKLMSEGYIEKASISWVLSDKPKTMQKGLLDKFKKEHGEFPAWNAPKKAPEKTPPKAKTARTRTKRKPSP